MKIYVTNKACHECLFTPERIFSSQEMKEFIGWTLEGDELGHIPECHCVTIARYQGKFLPFDEDAITCCFAFFYCYGRQMVYLREAIEQGMIEYFDITGFLGLRESKLELYGNPKWYSHPCTSEQREWANAVSVKYAKE